MKLARYSSSVASVVPVHDIFRKSRCRLPFNIFHGSLKERRRIFSYSQKHQLSSKAEMVVEKYLPPWFR